MWEGNRFRGKKIRYYIPGSNSFCSKGGGGGGLKSASRGVQEFGPSSTSCVKSKNLLVSVEPDIKGQCTRWIFFEGLNI
jgi:hypothetical protein